MYRFKPFLTPLALGFGLVGCHGYSDSSDGCDAPPAPPYFSAHSQGTGSDTLTLTRAAGATVHGTLDLDMTRAPAGWCTSYTGTVTLRAKGLPVGITGTFDPATVPADVSFSGPILIHLNVEVAPTVADGSYSFYVEAMEAPDRNPYIYFHLKIVTAP